ncbi:hypothetical protein EW146_g8693 [Bondarzewia mesenterica]|uniref:Uncharacterized protein n=1 Tax=Bondarzewia mesenterica TaxID=1095465 RepID=A0A4S4LCA0_9AGAM|nr:hypothetical protein EW146_g8693 [Bondarzewia mesenterica]
MHEIGLPSSSFNEPLSSAMSSEMAYPSSPPVIPMFPNGTPGSKPNSFRNALPVQRMAAGITDGMSEGLGRLRREIGKVRSPRLIARPDNASTPAGDAVRMPLEFDEEDEDFLLTHNHKDISLEHDDDDDDDDDAISRSTSRGEGDSAASISTPSSGMEELTARTGDGGWLGWELEDGQAVEDIEQFHEISVVGFMDEEQAQMKRRGRPGGM